MAGYRSSSLFAFLWTETSLKRKKKTRPISCHLGQSVSWSIKDLLYVYGIKKTEKNHLRTCLFASTEKEASYSKSDGAFRFSRFLVLIYFRAPAWT